jgi:uncharacterized protein
MRSLLLNPHLHYFSLPHGDWGVFDLFGDGQVTIIDSEVYQLIHQPHLLAQSSPKLVNLLRRSHILTASHHHFSLKPKPADTLGVWFHLTNQCNFRCRYCYVSKTPEIMSRETIDQSLKLIFDQARQLQFSRLQIKLAGGEPTLEVNRLLYLVQRAQNLASLYHLDLEFVLLTNGYHLPSRLLQLALSQPNFHFMISLDGLASQHDQCRHTISGQPTFSHVIKTLDLLQSHRINPAISTTLTSLNLTNLPHFVSFLFRRRLYSLSFNFYRCLNYQSRSFLAPHPRQLTQSLLQVINTISKDVPTYRIIDGFLDRVNFSAPHLFTCGAGKNYLVVNHLGQIAKCHMLLSQTISPTTPSLLPYLDSQALPDTLTPAAQLSCRDCLWKHWCSGGCPLLREGSSPNPYCQIYQTLIPRLLWLEGLRVQQYGQNHFS